MLQEGCEIKQHSRSVVSVKYSESGQLLACASADKKLSVVKTDSGAATLLEGEHAYGINDCAWISENLVITGSDDQTVQVWDVVVGKIVSSFKGPKTFVYSLAVNPINRTIISGGYDGSLTTFHLSCKDMLQTFSGHSEPIVSLSIDAMGEHYASAAQDGLVRLWSCGPASQCLRTIVGTEKQSYPMSSVCYSPNSEYLLASSLDSTHRLVRTGLYDQSLATGAWGRTEVVRTYTGHTNSKYSVFSTLYSNASGNYVASGSEDGRVYLWSVDDAVLLATGEGHSGVVTCVAGNPDPQRSQLASSGNDGSVRLWNLVASQ